MAISELTGKQEAFCLAYVANSGQGTEAAKEAGYATKFAHVEAHRLLKNPKILTRVHSLTQEAFAKLAPAMLEGMAQLARNAKSEKVRHDSIRDLLDRAGHGAIAKVLNLEEGSALSEDELKARAQELMDELFKTRQPLLSKDGSVSSKLN